MPKELEPVPVYKVYGGCTPQRFASDFLNRSPVTLQAFCMKEHINPQQLPSLIDDIMIDWELTEQTHVSRSEAIRHLINHLRIKVKNEQRNNPLRQGKVLSGSDPKSPVGIEDVAQAILRRVEANKGE